MDNSVIKLSEYNKHLSSGDLARALRSRVQNKRVTFDFSGVESVSVVFFDDLFGKLLESYGEQLYNQHVSCMGLTVGQSQMLADVLNKHKHKR